MSHSHPSTVQQLDALLDFLDEHRDLARGHLRSADGRERSKRLWEEAAQMLNSIGGSIKTVKQWQKVWTDRKHQAKKIAGANKKSAGATGGGPSEQVPLSPWELRVLDIMGEGFGGPQTTATVPAFRQNWDFDDELLSYSTSSQRRQPQSQPSSQPPLIDQASSQPPVTLYASFQSTSSQPPLMAQVLPSQQPVTLQATSRSHSIIQASSQNSLDTQATSQPPLILQTSSLSPSILPLASSQPLLIPQVSSELPWIAEQSSQTPPLLQTSSQSPSILSLASPQRPLAPQTSSQIPLIAQVSSQPPLIPQTSSQPPIIPQASSRTPIIPQASSRTPIIPQASNQQANTSGSRTGTNRRRITSRRGAAAEDSIQNRLFAIETKRLELERKKIDELMGLRHQLSELTSTLRGMPELAVTIRELSELTREFLRRQ